MYTGSIIDDLVRSVEMVEERFYSMPVYGARRDNGNVTMSTSASYDVPYR